MVKKTIDFYYDYISPASYIAWAQLIKLCEQTETRINYKPILLGGVFKATGNAAPKEVPAKWEWIKKDFQRYADYYNLPYMLNPHFIFSTVSAMRGAMWAASTNQIEAYNQAMFTAAWAEGKDLSSSEVLSEVLNNAGFDATVVIEAMSQTEMKQALIQATGDAVEKGVFGAPTMIVNNELFFGQDRLEWVKRALS